MQAYAEVRLGDGSLCSLGHGDFIGRLWTAALIIDDPRVSEAHALVSLRGAALRLLALRGRFLIDGASSTDVRLRAGLFVTLAEGVVLEVVRVFIPRTVLALQGPGMPAQLLQGVVSLVAEPAPMLVSGMRADARHWVWSDGRQWLAAGPGSPPTPLVAGEALNVDGAAVVAVDMPVAPTSGETMLDAAGDAPLHIVARFDTAHVQRDGKVVCAIEGVSARLLTELVLVGGPIGWRALADQLWRDDADAAQQRQRLDVALTRLRARLRAAGVRADLVRSTGTGHIELFLHPHDHVEDAA